MNEDRLEIEDISSFHREYKNFTESLQYLKKKKKTERHIISIYKLNLLFNFFFKYANTQNKISLF